MHSSKWIVGVLTGLIFFGFGGVVLAQDSVTEANVIVKSGTSLDVILQHTKKKKNVNDQAYAMKKYTEPMVKNAKGINISNKYAINNFIVYGTLSTHAFLAQERFDLVKGYNTKYKKLPITQNEWTTLLNIVPKCVDNSQCKEICEWCEKGKQLCVQPKGVCVTCIANMDCHDDYECIHNPDVYHSTCNKKDLRATSPTWLLPVDNKLIVSKKCSSMDCLIALARSCKKGELVYSSTTPFPFGDGMKVNSKTHYKIQGKNSSGVCIFTQQSRGGAVIVTSQERQKLMKQGTPAPEIDAQLKAMTASMNNPDYLKVVATCTGTSKNVATYFGNIQQGGTSTDCTSSLGSNEAHCRYEPNISCVARSPQ